MSANYGFSVLGLGIQIHFRAGYLNTLCLCLDLPLDLLKVFLPS